MKQRSRRIAIAASLLLTACLAACGSDEGDGGADNGATPTPTQTQSAPAQMATVTTAESDLGTILVDDEGMTLYLFTNDTRGSGESTCEGNCLREWPPLNGQPTAGEGVDAALLGTITATDGSTQVTYNGWPMYYWFEDSEAGDTTGQGVGSVWWVVSPQGDAIR